MTHRWIINKQTPAPTPKRRTRTTKLALGTQAHPMLGAADVRRLVGDAPVPGSRTLKDRASSLSKGRRAGAGAVRKQRQAELEAELEERRVTKLATGETVLFVVADEPAARAFGADDDHVAKTRVSYNDVVYADADAELVRRERSRRQQLRRNA